MPGRLLEVEDGRVAKGQSSGLAKPDVSEALTAPRTNGTFEQHPAHADEHIMQAKQSNLSNDITQANHGQANASLVQGVAATEGAPEIEHITQNFHPLSRIIERASQQCYNSLSELLSGLSTLPETPQVNGDVHSHSTSTASGPGLERRVRWLNFANSNRETFLKLYVLLQWSKNVDDVSKLIDVFAWMRARFDMFSDAEYFMGLVARDMPQARIPNPDIETALEVLSTGKVARMPELDYIPPAPLSPRKILRTLRNLNVLLHIRLNLHETLPPHFRTYAISSGRATFTVPSEFEVDLFIADEDPSAPFYFNDLRFLFSPRSEIPAGQIRLELDGRVNSVLATDGLAGCYNFLHDFVLTHKINVLRRQALELSKAGWAGSIRVEQMHRSLIIQYWTDRPGPKSWIEIGVESGVQPNASAIQNEQSSLAIRWTRTGQQIDSKGIQFDAGQLDIEAVLKSVISRHISHIFRSVFDRFSAALNEPVASSLAISTSDSEPSECSLCIPFSLDDKTFLRIEPISGTFALSRLSPRSMRCEDALNSLKDPATEAFTRLQYWRATELIDTLESAARRAGWHPARPDLNPKSIEKHCGTNVIRLSYFRPWFMPQSPWVVAAAVGPGRESWWILKYANQDESSTNSLLRSERASIVFAKQILATPNKHMSSPFLSTITLSAVSAIAQEDITQQLKRMSVPCNIHSPTSTTRRRRTTTFAISLNALLQSSPQTAGERQPDARLWATDTLTLEHRGLKSNSSSRDGIFSPPRVIYLAKGIMSGPSHLHELLSATQLQDISFGPDGTFAILLTMPLGSTDVINVLLSRLLSLLRLRKYVEMMKRHDFKSETISMTKVAFAYGNVDITSNGKKQDLRCSLDFREDGSVDLTFAPANNPHHRLKSLFSKLLNSQATAAAIDPTSAFERLARLLPITLHPLLALDNLERQQKGNRAFVVTVHSLSCYWLTYKRPRCRFEISYGMHRDDGQWKITQINLPFMTPKSGAKGQTAPRLLQAPEATNAKLKDELKALFHDTGDGWFGLRTGLVAEPEKLGRALEKLDEVVRDAADGEEPDAEAEESAEEEDPPEGEADGTQAPSTTAGAPTSSADARDQATMGSQATSSGPSSSFPTGGSHNQAQQNLVTESQPSTADSNPQQAPQQQPNQTSDPALNVHKDAPNANETQPSNGQRNANADTGTKNTEPIVID